MAREPPWKQNGLPPVVNTTQIAHGFFTSPLGFASVVPSNGKPSSGFELSLSLSLPAIAASHFVHSLVEHSCQRSIFLQF